VLNGVLLGTSAWMASGSFVSLPHDSSHVEYLFLSASWTRLAVCIVLACALAEWARRRDRGYAPALLLASLDPLALLAFVPAFAPVAGPLVFVGIDLRWWRVGVAALYILQREIRRRYPDLFARRMPLPILDAAIFAIAIVFAVATNTLLRFSNHLHGDEPKYVRYCENLYQGNGFDLTDFKPAADLGRAPSHVLRNFVLIADVLRLEARRIGRDVREFQRDPSAYEFNRARFSEGWFVYSKRGRLYQVHTPGVSLLLMPFYYLDRHVLSGDETTTDGQFAGRLWATNGFFLLTYAAFGVVIFRFLRNACGSEWLAWTTALIAVVTIPIAAFAFQLYPETIAGVFAIATCNFLAFGKRAMTATALIYGALTGYLPWLHVRFLGVAAVLLVWAVISLRHDRKRALAFAVAWAVVVGALCFHAYHITGSFVPTALYTTEGGPVALSVARIPWGLRGFVFDRGYGLVSYSPWYFIALAGLIPFARRQPMIAAFAAIMLLVLAVPSAAHSWHAAGGSPLRHLVALVPLALLPLSEAALRYRGSRMFWIVFVTLAVLSIQNAVAYNRLHYKTTGAMVDESVSGWKINLLFPDIREGHPLWPRALPEYLASPDDSRVRARDELTRRGCTLCLSSDRGRVSSGALVSLKLAPER